MNKAVALSAALQLCALLAPVPAAADDSARIALYETAVEQVVRVYGPGGFGSGFALEGHPGVIATAWHVVEDSVSARGFEAAIETPDGILHAASLLAWDRQTDVALLQVEGLELSGLTLAEAVPPVGATSYGLGHPLMMGPSDPPLPQIESERAEALQEAREAGRNNLPDDEDLPPVEDIVAQDHGLLAWSLTEGMVSQVGAHQIQTTTSLQPGNSGGPLLDAAGRVIGVVVQRRGDFGVATRLERLTALFEQEEAPPLRPRVRMGLRGGASFERLPDAAERRRGYVGFRGDLVFTIHDVFVLSPGVRTSWLVRASERERSPARSLGVALGLGPRLRPAWRPPRLPWLWFEPFGLVGFASVGEGSRSETLQQIDPSCDPSTTPCLVERVEDTEWVNSAHAVLGGGVRIQLTRALLTLELSTSPTDPLGQLRLALALSAALGG